MARTLPAFQSQVCEGKQTPSQIEAGAEILQDDAATAATRSSLTAGQDEPVASGLCSQTSHDKCCLSGMSTQASPQVHDSEPNSHREIGHNSVENAIGPGADVRYARFGREGQVEKEAQSDTNEKSMQQDELGTMAALASKPLCPPLRVRGPPSFPSPFRALFFRTSAFVLSSTFLAVVVVAALITSIPTLAKKVIYILTFRDINTLRPFYEEECRRADTRREKQRAWEHYESAENIGGDQEGTADDYPPTEGGKDRLLCDVGYYAKRVGLEVDMFHVCTEDDFVISLWHVYDPKEYLVQDASEADAGVNGEKVPRKVLKPQIRKPKFPVLLLPGLLQSSGAYCCNDDDSLAFWLCKSGFDVWLGNNRCGPLPNHKTFSSSDPRMWSWTIRHMATFDLPALVSRVLAETGIDKLGLICHSQGSAETLIALAKDQRPELGEKLSVFCALAPAAYAGPLVDRMCLRFMRQIPAFMFQMTFGIHAFIPLILQMQSLLNPRIYAWLGYRVFSFLFKWSDLRWDRELRDRLFQFAPVYVSAEAMQWWLGQDGFARHRCILFAGEVVEYEERRDDVAVKTSVETFMEPAIEAKADMPYLNNMGRDSSRTGDNVASTWWYNEQVPPFAMWVCGKDRLVDGQRLLRRFESGREPHVQLVHSKVIDEYEHLDILWAIDAAEQVFYEIREVLWKTCHVRDRCRVPEGCEGVPAWTSSRGRV
ncbi:hypothetical protein UVI_02054330 [Ustilaginoidea virens]|uniref:Partial AB-hydrolase lipase domain-containing protein n=1 Tax=Ustilaginoidea virens TaxID=1159556 RepID=A0A1B5L9Q9_USTVR|nr:hypothetical protein UVI_02054330 [Ustilaginoidea virens]